MELWYRTIRSRTLHSYAEDKVVGETALVAISRNVRGGVLGCVAKMLFLC